MKKLLSISLLALFSLTLVTFVHAAEFKSVDISVEGMTCGASVNKVETSLKKIEGVKEAEVSLKANSAKVVYDASKTDANALKAAVASAGFKAIDVKAYDKKSDAKKSSSKKAGCGAGSCCGGKGSS